MSFQRLRNGGSSASAALWAARIGGAIFFAFFVFLLTVVFLRPVLMGSTRWMDPLELSGIAATFLLAGGLFFAYWRPRIGGAVVIAASLWPLVVTLMRGLNPWVYLTVLLVGVLYLAAASVEERPDGEPAPVEAG